MTYNYLKRHGEKWAKHGKKFHHPSTEAMGK
jgi:hypothetical protein